MSLTVPNLNISKPAMPQSRNIVKLKPGKGIMDWTRLASAKHLASASLPFVDESELSKHNSVDDCWILLYGMVYDVTAYLEFHPGGVDELMRAAGTDATELFNEYHQWVNYRSMLSSCLVGPFKGSVLKLRRPNLVAPAVTVGKPIRPTITLQSVGVKSSRIVSNGLVLDFLTEPPPLECVVVAARTDALRILLRNYGTERTSLRFKGSGLEERFVVLRDDNSLRVEFQRPIGIVDVASVAVEQKPAAAFYKFEITSIAIVNHNCRIYTLRSPNSVLFPIPLGHHVTARLRKKANVVLRPYTPISQSDASCSGGTLDFLVKIYEDGIFTPVLASLSEGDFVELSDPVGERDIAKMSQAKEVLMFAAGSGLTPMVNIIAQRLSSTTDEQDTKLFLFNREEKDIVDDMHLPFSFADERISTTHVLSEPPEEWSGWRGRLNAEMMEGLLQASSSEDTVAFVCGPLGFNELCARLLKERQFADDKIVVFQ